LAHSKAAIVKIGPLDQEGRIFYSSHSVPAACQTRSKAEVLFPPKRGSNYFDYKMLDGEVLRPETEKVI
jgi:hypothetical protein